MEKVIQEFRVIETDDGFRIEIKGDKEQLRDFVMGIDPRQWMRHGPGPHFGGPGAWRHHGKGKGTGFRFGPMGGWFGFGGPWDWEEEDEEKRKHEGEENA
jgi:hypothetical protein